MKCYQCGYEGEQDFTYCPNCGFAAPTPVNSSHSAADMILPALKDPLFLVLCILMSASCILSLMASSVPLLNILFTIFLWLTYSQAQKGIADDRHLRCISGTVYAQYIYNYVLAGLLVLLGILFSVLFGSLASNPELIDSILSYIGEFDAETIGVLSTAASLSGGLIMVVCIFAALIIILINVFSLRYIHGFAKSVYQSVQNGSLNLQYTGATKVMMIILTICAGINILSSLENITALASAIVTFGTSLIPVILINKYFS